MPDLLLADIGSTFTKVCRVDAENSRLIATASSPTTVSTDVMDGLERACRGVGADLEGSDHMRLLACSSAAGGLRIAAVGLVPSLTAKAAEMAALGAGAKVVGVFPFLLTHDDMSRLERLAPDLILLSGGTDGGDTEHIVANARTLAGAFTHIPLVVAGNRAAHDRLSTILRAWHGPVRMTANVMPELGRLDLEPARTCIRELFLERIVVAKGMGRVRVRADLLLPTPDSVMRSLSALRATWATTSGAVTVATAPEEAVPSTAARALKSATTPAEGDCLLVVDVGGATTDVYSYGWGRPASPDIVYRGLPEPLEKRTVEADLGVRYTLASLVEQMDSEAVARDGGLTTAQLEQWVSTVTGDTARLPTSPVEQAADTVLAQAACHLAVTRHCGNLEEVWTPQGRVLIQQGKDLTEAAVVAGTGGPAAHDTPPGAVPRAAVRRPGDAGLLPRNPRIVIDRGYILWALGLLVAADLPGCATALAANHLVHA